MKKSGFILLLSLLLCALISAGAQEYRTLNYGCTGDDVLALQVRLTELGYYTFKQTGNYQERTRAAIRAFQRVYGLKETGEASPELQEMIFSEAAWPKPTPTPVPTPTPAPTFNLYVAYDGTRLEFGSTGEQVKRVQTKLKELGYYTIEISGNFLGNTRNAVKDFQRQNALSVDGIVGEQTWNTLFFDETAVSAADTPKPTPSPTPVPYRITVDVTNQITTVYGLDAEGDYTAPVRRMICSTGTVTDPTPLGVFTLNGRTARWCYFDQWGTHAQYWTRITSSIAFHSVIYSEPNEMALKTGSYTALGERASHGCIRLLVEDAKWIYQNCRAGTEVEILERNKDPELTRSLKPAPLDRSVMLPQVTPSPSPYPVYTSDSTPPMPFKTLEMGVENEAVYHLQCKLAELGYYQGTITGGYYEGTREAVKAFQRDHGLTADGKAGKITLSVLYEDILATPSPTPAASPSTTIAPQSTP